MRESLRGLRNATSVKTENPLLSVRSVIQAQIESSKPSYRFNIETNGCLNKFVDKTIAE
jgi:hypothetical protein